MIEFVYGHDEEVSRFVSGLIPQTRGHGFGRCKTIGIIKDGAPIAGIVFNNWNPEAGTINFTIASLSPVWLSRAVMRRMADYVFDEVHCQMLIGHARSSDERILRQLAIVGFMFVAVPRLYGRHEDGVLCLLTQENWLSGPIGRRIVRHVEIKEAA